MWSHCEIRRAVRRVSVTAGEGPQPSRWAIGLRGSPGASPVRVTRRGRAGLTRVEVAAVVGIVLVFMALTGAVLVGARERARSNLCLGNLSQLGLALRLYARDYDGVFPHNAVHGQVLIDGRYLRYEPAFTCPSQPRPAIHLREGVPCLWGSYYYEAGHGTNDPGDSRLMYDTAFAHEGKANVVFVNGGCYHFSRSSFDGFRWPVVIEGRRHYPAPPQW